MTDENTIAFDDQLRLGLHLGISLGIACSAGVAGECDDMTGRQIGAMLESMCDNKEAIQVLADTAFSDALTGTVTPKKYTKLIAGLMTIAAKMTSH